MFPSFWGKTLLPSFARTKTLMSLCTFSVEGVVHVNAKWTFWWEFTFIANEKTLKAINHTEKSYTHSAQIKRTWYEYTTHPSLNLWLLLSAHIDRCTNTLHICCPQFQFFFSVWMRVCACVGFTTVSNILCVCEFKCKFSNRVPL